MFDKAFAVMQYFGHDYKKPELAGCHVRVDALRVGVRFRRGVCP